MCRSTEEEKGHKAVPRLTTATVGQALHYAEWQKTLLYPPPPYTLLMSAREHVNSSTIFCSCVPGCCCLVFLRSGKELLKASYS